MREAGVRRPRASCGGLTTGPCRREPADPGTGSAVLDPSMSTQPRVLLQTTIAFDADDWHIGRFSMLATEIARWANVTARNHEPYGSGDDPVLASLDREQFDELWILAVDGGQAMTVREIAAINRFLRDGGGVLTARDHCNMGLWLRAIEGVGAANYFHDPSCWDPDPSRRARDEAQTSTIDWPNYHSGRNGEVEPIAIVEPVHELLRNPRAASGHIERLPAHPHEGDVGVPANEPRARSIARRRSSVTGLEFDLAVAFERTEHAPGRAIAESSFHHFADYNWDTSRGAPSFVTEPASDATRRDPHLLDDARLYIENCVAWLAPA